MQQVLKFPEPFARLAIRCGDEKWSDEEYWAFCMANSGLHIERAAQCEMIIFPPTGGETAYRNTIVAADLHSPSQGDVIGKGFGSSVQFFLPDGSALSPDATPNSNRPH